MRPLSFLMTFMAPLSGFGLPALVFPVESTAVTTIDSVTIWLLTLSVKKNRKKQKSRKKKSTTTRNRINTRHKTTIIDRTREHLHSIRELTEEWRYRANRAGKSFTTAAAWIRPQAEWTKQQTDRGEVLERSMNEEELLLLSGSDAPAGGCLCTFYTTHRAKGYAEEEKASSSSASKHVLHWVTDSSAKKRIITNHCKLPENFCSIYAGKNLASETKQFVTFASSSDDDETSAIGWRCIWEGRAPLLCVHCQCSKRGISLYCVIPYKYIFLGSIKRGENKEQQTGGKEGSCSRGLLLLLLRP